MRKDFIMINYLQNIAHPGFLFACVFIFFLLDICSNIIEIKYKEQKWINRGVVLRSTECVLLMVILFFFILCIASLNCRGTIELLGKGYVIPVLAIVDICVRQKIKKLSMPGANL